MREIEKFRLLRNSKARVNLNSRFTLVMAAVVFLSLTVAYLLSLLLEWLFPFFSHIPLFVQLGIFSLMTAIIVAQFCSKLFIDPITKLRKGMQEIADGNFDIRLESASTSKEVQEVLTGFNMMAQELRATEVLQTDFISNVSHEFKTPINAIEGYATLLQGAEHLDCTESAYVEKILASTRRLSSLVSNVLLLSRIENQSLQLHATEYSLDEQIREAILALEPNWEKKDIEFDVELEPVQYNGVEGMMYHVWSNLIGNAIKFSPDCGCLTLRLTENNDGIQFQITDQGPGISKDAQKHIFDKFYQEDTSHKAEGNGLGLALVKNIVTAAGGTVSAENMPQGGCRFTVQLIRSLN